MADLPSQSSLLLPPDANPLALDLLDKMLVFNPHKRISVDEALAHPYLKTLHNVKSESECKRMFDFEFEKSANTSHVHTSARLPPLPLHSSLTHTRALAVSLLSGTR
jgi:serine/threonine protein kinase